MESKQIISILSLRIALGIIFLISGIGKLFLGMAPPLDKILFFIPLNVSAYLLGLLEFIVGVLLLLGLLTRIAAWISAALLVIFLISGAALGIFAQAGLLKDVGLLAAAVCLALFGHGCWGLDGMFRVQREAASAAVSPTPEPQMVFSASYYASKNRKLYHRQNCLFIRNVGPLDLLQFADAAEARQKGNRACKCTRVA